MPEYLAPGVFMEETSFRSKSIEGVSTSTAAFIGPTRFGPISLEPEVLTSYAEFERIYGGLDQMEFADASGKKTHNWTAQAVRSFFDEGGRRLYISRVYNGSGGEAAATITVGTQTVTLQARYPGAAGNVPVSFTFRLGPNILGREAIDPTSVSSPVRTVLRGVSQYDVVWVAPKVPASMPGEPPSMPSSVSTPGEQLYWVDRVFESGRWTHELKTWDDSGTVTMASLDPAVVAGGATPVTDPDWDVRVLTVNVTVGRLSQFAPDLVYQNLALDSRHPSGLSQVFSDENPSRASQLYVPLVITAEDEENGAAIAYALVSQTSLGKPDQTVLQLLDDAKTSDADRTCRVRMTGGSDGNLPGAAEYEGDDSGAAKTGFLALEDIEDISIVAAPGATYNYEQSSRKSEASQIVRMLIGHAERMRYRIAVIDSGDNQTVSQVRAMRGQLDSTHAALYYPWVRVLDPVTRAEINLPPSGFVAGIYARNDNQYGVHKAPANEVVRGAIGFEFAINRGQQEVLNPEGINCFRFFEGRGYRLWGARTISSDPEWKYVNVRRYFNYLERSIDKGTQWVVFMNNNDALWGNVRRTLEDFLFNEWRSERLLGTKPEEAYFVKCDRSTMTQNDLDNGRLICLIGVSPVKPAEFVIFRIGQWTADRKA